MLYGVESFGIPLEYLSEPTARTTHSLLWNLFWAWWIQSSFSFPISHWSILVLSLPLRFSDQNFVCISRLSLAYYMTCHAHAGELGANINSEWYCFMLHGFSLWPWKVVACHVVVIPEFEARLPGLKNFLIVFCSSSKLWNNTALIYVACTLVCSRKRHLVAVVWQACFWRGKKIMTSCGLV